MSLEDIRRAYEKATRRWTGCDWPTRFGKAGLNLCGLSSQTAADKAQQPGEPRDDWLAARHWLAQIEQCADRAEMQAALALAAANAGDFATALQHAESACAIERATGRVEALGSSIWNDFRQAIAAACRECTPGALPPLTPLPQAASSPVAQLVAVAGELRALARRLDDLARRLETLNASNTEARSAAGPLQG